MKQHMLLINTAVMLLALMGPGGSLTAQEQKWQPAQVGEQPLAIPPIQKISPGVWRLGEIQIHKKARSVTFPAEVNMDKGLIEYLLVKSSGKTHESLLSTQTDPYFLNIAFLLLGFEGTDTPLDSQGAEEKPQGEQVQITIVHREGGKQQRVLAEQWITKKEGEKESDVYLTWVYTGSKVMQGRFLAQDQGSIVAVYRDPVALVDNATEGAESDEIWFVKEGVAPAPGTPVTVVIKAK